MISHSAKMALNQWFSKALKESMVAASGDQCAIETEDGNAAFPETKVVMLTSSSYVYRIFTVIYFDADLKTREHFARRTRADAQDMTDQEFIDAVCESANMTCGSLNRDLGRVYPHIGLSTPNILEARSADHLNVLQSGHLQHFRVDINGATLFHASMCVCEFADMDFSVGALAAVAEEEVDSGELEMF